MAKISFFLSQIKKMKLAECMQEALLRSQDHLLIEIQFIRLAWLGEE